MKRIEIFIRNNNKIVIDDMDNSNLFNYTNELSKLLENSKVTILETSEKNLILKPSEISSILVYEIEKNVDKTKTIINKNEKNIIDSNDIIKD